MSGSLGQMAIKFAPMLAALAAAPFTGGATAALTPYLGAAGAGATAATIPGLASGATGGILGATGAGQPKLPSLASLTPPVRTASAAPFGGGGGPEVPGSGLTLGQPFEVASGGSNVAQNMGTNVAQNLFSPQFSQQPAFYQYQNAA